MSSLTIGAPGDLPLRHQRVDLVAVEGLVGHDGHAGKAGGFLLLAEIVRVLDHVLLHQIEVFQHLGQVGIGFPQFVHQVNDG